MRRLFALVIVIVLIFSLSVTSFAFSFVKEHQWVENGNTVIGTLKTSLLTTAQKEFMREWFQSDKNLMTYSLTDRKLYFFIFDKLVPVNLSRSSNGNGVSFQFTSSVPVRFVTFLYESWQPVDAVVHSATYSTNPYILGNVVSSSYLITAKADTKSLDSALFLEYTGKLMYRDDDGLIPDNSGDDGILKSIIDWIKSFFEQLKNLIIGLFVPKDGYFEKWFNEIKTAFESKTGGLSGAFGSVSGSFERLKNGSANETKVMLKLPDNWLYSGFKGSSVNLLGHAGGFMVWLRRIFNGLLIIFTCIICYQQLIKTIKT